MKELYAVIYTDCWGTTRVVNLAANGKSENASLTEDIRHAQEVAEYMTATVGQMRYRPVKVILEEL